MSFEQTENTIGKLLELVENAEGERSAGRFCGLKTPAKTFEHVVEKLKKNHHIYKIKIHNPRLPLIISLQGGTGTGKSTIFNAVTGRQISITGNERPKTLGPLLLCHRTQEKMLRQINLLAEYEKEFLAVEKDDSHIGGDPLKIKVLCHEEKSLERFFIIDTPDVDSVELLNRNMADDIYNISDVILFITSQEKYGDRIPFGIFKQAIADGKHFIIIMNKVDSDEAFLELKERIGKETRSLSDEGRFFALPWVISDSPFEELKSESEMQRLKKYLFDREEGAYDEIRKAEISNLRRKLSTLSGELVRILQGEQQAIDELLETFQSIYENTKKQLLEKSLARLDETTKQHIQNEIRHIFRRYDLLRKPRSVISKIIRFPLSLLGLASRSEEEKRKRDLARLHRKIDLSALHLAINDLNRKIHNEIRIRDIEYLQNVFLSENMSMTVDEIDDLFFERQEKLEEWLQGQFSRLTKGIPKHKEWGIYSTTILWSLFLISVETVVGGGLSMFEAILDSVIMPFLSKGAVEIFAYHELKNIAEELDSRYREQLIEVLNVQFQRYVNRLKECAIAKNDFITIKDLVAKIDS